MNGYENNRGFTIKTNLLNRPCVIHDLRACADPEGGHRVWTPPLKNHKNIGLPSNTGLDPLKNHKASIQYRAIIGTPAKRHLNGGSLVGRCWPIYRGIWILYPLINYKNKKKRYQIWTILTKLSGSALDMYSMRVKSPLNTTKLEMDSSR